MKQDLVHNVDYAIRTNMSVWQVKVDFDTLHKACNQLIAEILKRDNHECHFCGFQSTTGMELYHLNDDHEDNAPENLATACGFCHAEQHLGLASDSATTLVYLPEVSQPDLNMLLRTIYVAQRYGAVDGTKSMVDGCLDAIELRRQYLAKQFPNGSPMKALTQIFKSNVKNVYLNKAQHNLVPLRIYHGPSVLFGKTEQRRDVFGQQLDAWAEDKLCFDGVRPSAFWAKAEALTI